MGNIPQVRRTPSIARSKTPATSTGYSRGDQRPAAARQSFKAAGIYVPGMACHALRRGGATQLYSDLSEKGHKNPLRLVKTALDHRSEQQSEAYLDISKDRRELAEMLAAMYGDRPEHPAAAPEAAAESPAQDGATVTSLAAFRAAKLTF